MRIWGAILLLTHFLGSPAGAAPASSEAAEYYFRNQDYRKSLALWGEFLQSQPDNVGGVLRVGELTLLLEGRPSLDEFISRQVAPRVRSFSPEQFHQLNEGLERLQSRFLTDKGQARYLQSLEHFKVHDCKEALVLLDEAVSLEKGNLRALQLKASCEAALELWEKRFSTLKRAARSNPLQPEVQQRLFESYVYFGEYGRLIAELQGVSAKQLSPRERTAWAVALWNEKKNDSAWRVVRGLLSEPGSPKHPVLYFLAGDLLSDSTREQASRYFKTFLARAADPGEILIDGLDPYHTERFLPLAQKFLGEKTL
ncbi:MAG: hypothetical protein H6617_11410 [Bdellovibrionaceae bacterium]|nr:hypothetical protein [Bdellovibrionales bacterium]MCB9255280.1 hypothetical protein [Pseudobdellovibrionaceae bacterium]